MLALELSCARAFSARSMILAEHIKLFLYYSYFVNLCLLSLQDFFFFAGYLSLK